MILSTGGRHGDELELKLVTTSLLSLAFPCKILRGLVSLTPQAFLHTVGLSVSQSHYLNGAP